MASFSLKMERPAEGAAPVLVVRGDLDLYTAPEFNQRLNELAESEQHDVVVDLSGSSFIDSSACRALLRAARRLDEHGARLAVVNRDPEVSRIFSVMGLEAFLVVAESREDALSLLAV
jgi:anti-sigma B factor antagonist